MTRHKNAGSAAITNPQADQPEYDPSYDYHSDPVAILYISSHLRLVVDLQTNIKAQQNAAYARKVKLSKKVQQDFLKARFKKKYREEHKDELDKYAASVSFFREHYEGQIPSMKQLKAEKEKLLTLQKEQKIELAALGKQDRVLQTASANVNAILHTDDFPSRKNPSRQPEL